MFRWAAARRRGSPSTSADSTAAVATASQSIGLDPILIRTTAFALSAAAAGLAGGLFASISNFISPESFPFFQSILFVLVVMAGGSERMLGPVVGAIIVWLATSL